jgi:hypothetical protein
MPFYHTTLLLILLKRDRHEIFRKAASDSGVLFLFVSFFFSEFDGCEGVSILPKKKKEKQPIALSLASLDLPERMLKDDV